MLMGFQMNVGDDELLNTKHLSPSAQWRRAMRLSRLKMLRKKSSCSGSPSEFVISVCHISLEMVRGDDGSRECGSIEAKVGSLVVMRSEKLVQVAASSNC